MPFGVNIIHKTFILRSPNNSGCRHYCSLLLLLMGKETDLRGKHNRLRAYNWQRQITGGCKQDFDFTPRFLLIIVHSLCPWNLNFLCIPCHAQHNGKHQVVPVLSTLIRKHVLLSEEKADPLSSSVHCSFPITGVLLQHQLILPFSETRNCQSLSSLSADILET